MLFALLHFGERLSPLQEIALLQLPGSRCFDYSRAVRVGACPCPLVWHVAALLRGAGNLLCLHSERALSGEPSVAHSRVRCEVFFRLVCLFGSHVLYR